MTHEVTITIFKTRWAKAGTLSHNLLPRAAAETLAEIKSPEELDKSLSLERSRWGKGGRQGGQKRKTKRGRAAVSWNAWKMQRGVVILPDHVLARACPNPEQSAQPHSESSGALCGSVSPGHGFWPSARHWPFSSSVSASHSKQSVLPVSIKRDTVFNSTVTEHELPRQRHRSGIYNIVGTLSGMGLGCLSSLH